jgi:AIPR protein
MNNKEQTATLIKFPVVSFRKIPSPYDEDGAKTYVAVVNVKDVPEALENWRKINVRDSKTRSAVSMAIRETLKDDPASFFFRNRGMTVIVDKANYDNQTNYLQLEVSDPDFNGLLDGGHTYSVIREYLQGLTKEELSDFDAFVKIEIIEGITEGEVITNIVEARNTSTQVKEQSLEEHRKSYAAIHAILDKESYGKNIAYKEYELDEKGKPKEIDIKEILSYLVCFDTESFSDTKHPIKAYSTKTSVVQHFKNNDEAMEKYIPLLPRILELRDYIYLELPEAYNKTGGRFGGLTGVIWTKNKPRMEKEHLYFSNKDSEYRIPSGFIYPILAAFRNLVRVKDGKCEWKEDPIKFFDSLKQDLASTVGKQAISFSNPNKLGKDDATWKLCYSAVEVATLRRGL